MNIVQYVNKDGKKIQMINQFNVMIAKCGYIKNVMKYLDMTQINLNNIDKIKNLYIDVLIVEDN